MDGLLPYFEGRAGPSPDHNWMEMSEVHYSSRFNEVSIGDPFVQFMGRASIMGDYSG
jgi:hypothetical protein